MAVPGAAPVVASPARRGLQLGLLATAVCLVFIQSQAVAPLLPQLAAEFAAPKELAGLLIPFYALPYGVMALVYGPLSDRLGRRRVVLFCVSGLALGALGAALAPTLGVLLALRVLAGICAGGVVPIALATTADLYAYQERGRAIGVIFGALSLGQALGYSLGPMLAAWVDWRGLFGLLAGAAGLVAALLLFSPLPGRPATPASPALAGYRQVLAQRRALRVYAFIIAGGLCVTGVTAWFGVYVHDRFGFDGLAIGLAYLPYGLAGLLSPLGGALADRFGRGRLIPLGLLGLAVGTLLLALDGPLLLALAAIALLAFAFQFTYPLLSGLVSEFVPTARGSALGLNTFSMFMGVGWGSFLAGLLLPWGYPTMFGALAALALVAALAAFHWLRAER